jgi:phosphoglycerate dehydrogenase-like enzyme
LESRFGSAVSIDTWVAEDGLDSLAQKLEQAEAAIAMRWEEDFPPAPKLRLLQLPGAGYDGIHFAAVPTGCQICNVHEHEIGIAEYCLLAMLEHYVRLRRMDHNLRQGDWSDSLLGSGAAHGELMGKTVGIVGYGHIGEAVAKRARAFDTRIVAVTRSPEGKGGDLDWIAGMESLDRLLAESDVAILACALTDETRGLINTERFGKMKSDALLINVARGGLIEEDDLYNALKDRRIGGAVIDVWYNYPTPEKQTVLPSRHPFHKLDNVIMSPHASGWTDALLERRGQAIADNIGRLISGNPLRNVIDRTRV